MANRIWAAAAQVGGQAVQGSGAHNTQYGLDKHGMSSARTVHWNQSVPGLYEHALRRRECRLAQGGPIVAITGEHTGRSPKDKFIVEEASTKDDVWWGEINQPIDAQSFRRLRDRVRDHLATTEVFVQDCNTGADPSHRLRVRLITENAWHALFARNMFMRPTIAEIASFVPDFTILHAPSVEADPERDGTNSKTFILVSFDERQIVIGGTSYAGEIKKSVFSILNYLLPAKDVLPMHASANIGPDGDSAIFFGLSGTGKTTLSADASRTLIGDDEHGWGENGLFNFEGGCYAKVIKLSHEAEPEIYATTSMFGTVLENVVMDENGFLDLDDGRHTENTRACYPVDFIPNTASDGLGPQPDNVIMLTADAFGVLPPISRMSPEQAMYHFLSGYTARVAGTEKGLGNEPEATFSTCFGAPFMPRHPSVYADLLGKMIAKHGVNCWLVNTGWSGGAYGVGERMKIAHTRAMVRSALDGSLAQVPTTPDPNFGLAIPEACPEVPGDVLNPKSTWSDKTAYDQMAREVAARFEKNFGQFENYVDDKVRAAAIHAAA
jgi:phosphoenolpyruvate carboxykinase (ATP)